MQIEFTQWGIISYQEAWQKQRLLFDNMVALKAANTPPHQQWISCQHPHVYTQGKHGKRENLLLTTAELTTAGITVFYTERGGDITYHGPGQLVCYPLLDLDQLHIGVKQYVYLLEQCVIETLQEISITADRLAGATGVWIDPHTPQARKICAIGIKASRNITMHGLALNVNTDLNYFSRINPCGFQDKGVTSIKKELNNNQEMDKIDQLLIKNAKRIIFNAIR